MGKLMDIPLNEREWEAFQSEILSLSQTVRQLPLAQMLLMSEEATSYEGQKTHLPLEGGQRQYFYFTLMLRDLYHFQQISKRYLDFLMEYRQKDATKVTKAKHPEGAKPLDVLPGQFDDEESDL